MTNTDLKPEVTEPTETPQLNMINTVQKSEPIKQIQTALQLLMISTVRKQEGSKEIPQAELLNMTNTEEKSEVINN